VTSILILLKNFDGNSVGYSRTLVSTELAAPLELDQIHMLPETR
jgi:hypothetical protein